jgi:hypothetical protein
MKSFVAYPLEFENLLFPTPSEYQSSGKLIAHYELFKKVSHLNGAIVKCGITAEEGFRRFAMFKEMTNGNIEQKMVAFEKFRPLFEEVVNKDGEITLKIKEHNPVSLDRIANNLTESGLKENIDFVPGLVSEAIPEYLIANPELKIALLNIDLDEYDHTLTTLEFLYPRIMPGGILIVDNFYKYLAEQKAVKDYFAPSTLTINNFSVNNGPHYIVKP